MKNNLIAKEAPRKETGFVAFFDILGYGSFLESGITDVTFKVVDILDGLPERINVALESHLGKPIVDCGSNINWAMNRVKSLVISDSILLRSSYDESCVVSKPLQAFAFLVTASVLERMMFEEGLPIRGAIAFGDFIFVRNIFAGKPIIDAHNLGQSLDLAACAIHPTAEIEFKTLITIAPDMENCFDDGPTGLRHVVRYPTPIKKDKVELQLLLNLAWPTLKEYPPLKDRTNPRRYIEEQFSAHNKKIGANEILKVENTEKFLHFLANRFPYLFNRDP